MHCILSRREDIVRYESSRITKDDIVAFLTPTEFFFIIMYCFKSRVI